MTYQIAEDWEYPVDSPEREYYVSPPPKPVRRETRRAGRRRQRRQGIPLPLLAGLLLLSFLLGRSTAAAEPVDPPPPDADNIAIQPILPDDDDPDPDDDWRLRLVNFDHLLPEDFQPPALTQLRNGNNIDSRAYPELQAMMDACRAAGLEPLICSSYRTREKQEELFQAKVSSYTAEGYGRSQAEELAAQWVARPDTSEHQTGLAVDIVDKRYQLLDERQEQTDVQKWLMAHCAEYGFILRYPTEKSALTGVNYEPWHYRYIGQEAAQEIMTRGICLEEYLAS